MTDPDEENIKQTILAIGQEVFAAITKKDVASLALFLAEEFIHRSVDGSESGKEEFLRSIREMPLEVMSIRGEHEDVRVYGEVAVMTGVQHAEWRQGDASGISSVAFADVFIKHNAGWLMVFAYGVDL